MHREIHYWRADVTEPPCGTLEERFDWSDALEDVTCEQCLAALAGDSGDLTSSHEHRPPPGDHHPAP